MACCPLVHVRLRTRLDRMAVRQTCVRCGKRKSVESFYKHQRAKNGRVGCCKACWQPTYKHGKTHMLLDKVVCGQPAKHTTTDPGEVDCKTCLSGFRACVSCGIILPIRSFPVYRRDAGVKRRYTKCPDCRGAKESRDHEFPGYGKLACRLCNRPYIEHPLGPPCPWGVAA